MQPLLAGLFRHMSSWLSALEQSEMSPEELWAHALRPNRERQGLIRTPIGQFSTSYSFYTGDMDTLYDPMSAEHLGATGMVLDALKILSPTEEAYKPRYGSEIVLGNALERISFAYWHYLQTYGPRLGWSPIGNTLNAGYEYLDKVHNKNIDLWNPDDKRTSLRRALRLIGSFATKYGGNVTQKVHNLFGEIESSQLEAILDEGFYQQPKGTKRNLKWIDLLMEEVGGFDAATRRVSKQYIQEVLGLARTAREAASILSKGSFPERSRQFLPTKRIRALARDKFREGTKEFEYAPGFGQSLEKMPRAAWMKKEYSDEELGVLNLLRAFQINPGE